MPPDQHRQSLTVSRTRALANDIKSHACKRASVVVYRNDKNGLEFLIISRSSDPKQYVLPGGHIETGENPRATAKRECFEEAGVRVQLHAPLTRYNHTKRSGVAKPTMVYLATAVSQKPSPEGRDARWVRIKDIRKGRCNVLDQIRDVLQHAHAHLATGAAA